MKTKYVKALIFLLLIITVRPIVSDESSIYCFVGDAGEVNPTQAMVVNSLANSDCSLVWHLGDITQLGVQSMDDPELQESFLKPFKPFYHLQHQALLKSTYLRAPHSHSQQFFSEFFS